MSDAADSATKPIRQRESYPQLISLTVHELRTPASVVGGYLRMLQRDSDPPLGERQRKMIDEAAKSCGRLVELIAELSDVGKLDAGLTTIAREPLDFFSLVEEVAGHVHEAEDREVRLEVRGPAAGAQTMGDPARLGVAIQAILRAILREMPSPSVVIAERRVGTGARSGSAVLVIASEETVQTAYDAEPAAFDEKRGGLGLALPIARRVIDAHGGRLSAPVSPGPDSEVAARGAAIVTIPLETNR
ncbi:MAG TPA: HAMP domain-containing sensor histidine kinase [Vicinamibacterales bacterium]